MNWLDEIVGALAFLACAGVLYALGEVQEHYSKLPPSERPRIERFAH